MKRATLTKRLAKAGIFALQLLRGSETLHMARDYRNSAVEIPILA